MENELSVTGTSYPALIEKAVNGGNLEIVSKMMDLQDRHEAKLAKKAFDDALTKFKENAPVIIKNKQGHNTKYADLAQIVLKATPIMSEYGLSSQWDTSTNPEKRTVTVTCELSHIDGHCKKVTMSEMYEDSGKKNRIQSMASAVTYLERYTFMAITGLAAVGEDDDGASAAPPQSSLSILQTLLVCGDSLGVYLLSEQFKARMLEENETDVAFELKEAVVGGLADKTKGAAWKSYERTIHQGLSIFDTLAGSVNDEDGEGVAGCLLLATNLTKSILKTQQPELFGLVAPMMKQYNEQQKKALAAKRQAQDNQTN